MLGVERTATQEEISKAYKRLARKFHPDVNKDPGAEDKFKELSEAYEVLGDKEKRSQYDALGANWKNGQEFRPPPNWEEMFGGGQRGPQFRTQSGGDFRFEGVGGFSDFFTTFFGGETGFDFGGMRQQPQAMRGHDLEAQLSVSLHEALKGATKNVSFEIIETRADGSRTKKPKSYAIKIRPGTRPNSTIRLSGQGGEGAGGGPSGDLLLRVDVHSPEGTKIEGNDIIIAQPVTPWEAVLGAKKLVTLPDGTRINVTVPTGSQSGLRLRIKGHGLPKRSGGVGDSFLELQIIVPEEHALSTAERALYEQLRDLSVDSGS